MDSNIIVRNQQNEKVTERKIQEEVIEKGTEHDE